MSDRDPIEMVVDGDFVKPSDRPVLGDRRLVRYLPAGLPGTKGMLLPCIWMSPYEVYDTDLKEMVKICILLLEKGPPKPEIIAIRLPSAAVEKFPTGPVEW